MSEEKVTSLFEDRKAISQRNRQLKASIEWHRRKAEDYMKEASEHLKKVREAESELSSNSKKFFDKGTEIEKLTGVKRIDSLK